MSNTSVSDCIRRMYEQVAFRYDLFNRVATFGLDGAWRRRAAEQVPKRTGMVIVDVCAGTGDMTLELTRRLGDGVLLLALDFSSRMLALCRHKILAMPAKVEFVIGRGEVMPLSAESADAACCAFALRNLESVMDGFLAELFRILRPGGKIVLLETGRPTAPVLRQAHRLYVTRIVPLEGRLVTGNAPAYRYLAESVQRFPNPGDFCRKLEVVGFREVSYRSLSWGVATVYTAYR